MTLLSRYLARQNLFLIIVILLISTGLYILTDLFERLDNFLESGVGFGMILLYFIMKIPSIISMTLPAVFMLAVVVQMNILERSREMIALATGGISPATLVRFVLLYGVVWAVAQFTFAQVIGVLGERVSSRIWQEEIRGKTLKDSSLQGLWFTERNHIVHVGQVWPLQRKGENLQVYILDNTGIGITEIIKAGTFTVGEQGWVLEEGERITPDEYAATPFARMELPLHQDLRAFQISAKDGIKPKHLSLLELSDAIAHLERAGSNVESLRTAWHEKLAYACSIAIMGLLALLVSRFTPNIYKAIFVAMLIVFFYHGINTVSVGMGEKGLVDPLIGAWFANAFFFSTGLSWSLWPSIRNACKKTYRGRAV